MNKFKEINLAEIQKAAERIAGLTVKTPCLYAKELSKAWGKEIYFKMENLQVTGGFKVRGNSNKFLGGNNQSFAKGVITASSGNHGLGLAYAARELKIKAQVVLPLRTPQSKIDKMKLYGAEIIIEGASYNESQDLALKIAQANNAFYVPSFDDRDIVIGNGTMGLEIFEAIPKLRTMICPVGGGGGITGIATALKALNPQIEIIGVQAQGAAGMVESLQRKERIRLTEVNTIAEGVAVAQVGALNFALAQTLIDKMFIVNDEEIKAGLKFLLNQLNTVAEFAGAVAFAALQKEFHHLKDPIVCLISGGNINADVVSEVLTS